MSKFQGDGDGRACASASCRAASARRPTAPASTESQARDALGAGGALCRLRLQPGARHRLRRRELSLGLPARRTGRPRFCARGWRTGAAFTTRPSTSPRRAGWASPCARRMSTTAGSEFALELGRPERPVLVHGLGPGARPAPGDGPGNHRRARRRAIYRPGATCVQRVPLQAKELAHLIQCGALDGLGASRAALLEDATHASPSGMQQMTFAFVGAAGRRQRVRRNAWPGSSTSSASRSACTRSISCRRRPNVSRSKRRPPVRARRCRCWAFACPAGPAARASSWPTATNLCDRHPAAIDQQPGALGTGAHLGSLAARRMGQRLAASRAA